MKYILSIMMLALTLTFTACSPKGSGTEDTSTLQPLDGSTPLSSSIKLLSIASSASASTTTAAKIQTQYKAEGLFFDDTVADLSTEVSWKSSDTSVVSIDDSGLATAVAPGTTIISARYFDVDSNEEAVDVATLVSISIENADEGDAVTVASDGIIAGTKKYAKAIGKFDNNETANITTSVVWKSSDATKATVDENGVITALSAGAVSVSVEYAKLDATLIKDDINGTIVSATIQTLDIEGENVSALKIPIKLLALATYDNSLTVEATYDANWTSSDESIATVDSLGVVKGIVAGNTIITCIYDGITTRHTVRFTNKVMTGLEIQDGYVENGAGTKINDTTRTIYLVDSVSYPTDEEGLSPNAYYPTAWAVYEDGTKEYIGDQAFWWSSNQQAVYLNYLKGSFVFGRDLAQGVEISATFAGHSASFKVNSETEVGTVSLDAIELRKDDGTDVNSTVISMITGEKLWVTAYGHYSDNSVKNINSKVFYSSDAINVANVFDAIDSNIRARGVGTANIQASWQGINATVTVNVTLAPTLLSIELQTGCSSTDTPANTIDTGANALALAKGDEVCLNAWGIYTSGPRQRLTTKVFWKSSDQDIAKMDLFQRDSKVKGIEVGSTTVSAKLDEVTGEATVNVTN